MTWIRHLSPAAGLGSGRAKARAGRWRLAICAVLVGLILGLAPAQAAPEYEVKAAFLYNFAKFIDWPGSTATNLSAPFVLGIVGEDPFGDRLAGIAQHEKIKGRTMEIRHYRPGDDLTGCQVLFVARAETARAQDLLRLAQEKSILSVGEDEEFLDQGGMIAFAIVEKNVRFDINAKAMGKAELKCSSKLLAIARQVRK